MPDAEDANVVTRSAPIEEKKMPDKLAHEDAASQETTLDEASHDVVSQLRSAALQTSSSILSLQRRAEDELHDAKNALEARTEELASSLSLLKATLESTADGIVVLDLSGKVVSYNSKFAAIWQFSDELLQRRDSRELMTYAAQQVNDSAGFLHRIQEYLTRPGIEIFDVVELKNGRTFERYGFPQYVNQECVGVVVNFREVTQRKQAESALRISEEKYRLLWATAGDAFVLFGSNNIILEANAALATIFGYQPEEVIGQDISILQPERFREGHRNGLQRYLTTQERTLN